MKKILCLVMSLALLISFAACARQATTEPAASAAASDSATASETAAAVGKDITQEPIKIAFLAAQMDANPVYWEQGIKLACSPYSNVEVTTFDANSSAETQNQQITECVNQGYDAIIINAADSTAIASAVTDAEAAGVNVIAINIGIECVYSGIVAADSYDAGRVCAEDAISRISGGNCVAIGAPVAMASTVRGAVGFEDAIKAAAGFTFLEEQPGDWTTETANTIMRDFLTKYNNDIQAVFCHNDLMAIGAAQAIEAAGLTGKVLVYGCDGLPEAIQYIAQGKMTGSVYQESVQQGMTAADLALYDIATGLDGSKLTTTPTVRSILTVINSSNYTQYQQ